MVDLKDGGSKVVSDLSGLTVGNTDLDRDFAASEVSRSLRGAAPGTYADITGGYRFGSEPTDVIEMDSRNHSQAPDPWRVRTEGADTGVHPETVDTVTAPRAFAAPDGKGGWVLVTHGPSNEPDSPREVSERWNRSVRF